MEKATHHVCGVYTCILTQCEQMDLAHLTCDSSVCSTYKSLKAYSLLNTPWPYQTSSFDLLTCNGVLRSCGVLHISR